MVDDEKCAFVSSSLCAIAMLCGNIRSGYCYAQRERERERACTGSEILPTTTRPYRDNTQARLNLTLKGLDMQQCLKGNDTGPKKMRLKLNSKLYL